MAPDHATRLRLIRILLLVLLAGVGAGAAFLMVGDFDSYFMERLAFQDYDVKRFQTQGMAVDVIRDYPWGIGPGQWMKGRFPQDTHNTYVRVVGENGLLGLLGLLVFFGANLFYALRLLRREPQHRALTCACIAVTTGVLAESIVIDTLHWRHLFLFLAVPTGLALHGVIRPSRSPS